MVLLARVPGQLLAAAQEVLPQQGRRPRRRQHRVAAAGAPAAAAKRWGERSGRQVGLSHAGLQAFRRRPQNDVELIYEEEDKEAKFLDETWV